MTLKLSQIISKINEDLNYYDKQMESAYVDSVREQYRGMLMYATDILDYIEVNS